MSRRTGKARLLTVTWLTHRRLRLPSLSGAYTRDTRSGTCDGIVAMAYLQMHPKFTHSVSRKEQKWKAEEVGNEAGCCLPTRRVPVIGVSRLAHRPSRLVYEAYGVHDKR